MRHLLGIEEQLLNKRRGAVTAPLSFVIGSSGFSAPCVIAVSRFPQHFDKGD